MHRHNITLNELNMTLEITRQTCGIFLLTSSASEATTGKAVAEYRMF